MKYESMRQHCADSRYWHTIIIIVIRDSCITTYWVIRDLVSNAYIVWSAVINEIRIRAFPFIGRVTFRVFSDCWSVKHFQGIRLASCLTLICRK